MTRLLLSCTAAVLLLAAPIGASAQAVNQMKPEGQPSAKPMTEAPMAKKPMMHKSMPMAHKTMAMKKPMHAKHMVMHKQAGDSAVEKLNEQSLMKAQGK